MSISSYPFRHFLVLLGSDQTNLPMNKFSCYFQKILLKINEREVKYQTVIRELVKRYIMKRQQKDQTEGVTEDDLNEIKQDVSAFR